MTRSIRSDESSHMLDGQKVATSGCQYARYFVQKWEHQSDEAHTLWVTDTRPVCVGKKYQG